MSEQSNEATIRAAFEQALMDGLRPQPLLTKDGPVTDPETKAVMTGPPEASFLSVVRAYLKDLKDAVGSKIPKTGEARQGGLLDQYQRVAGKGLPFGRPQ